MISKYSNIIFNIIFNYLKIIINNDEESQKDSINYPSYKRMRHHRHQSPKYKRKI